MPFVFGWAPLVSQKFQSNRSFVPSQVSRRHDYYYSSCCSSSDVNDDHSIIFSASPPRSGSDSAPIGPPIINAQHCRSKHPRSTLHELWEAGESTTFSSFSSFPFAWHAWLQSLAPRLSDARGGPLHPVAETHKTEPRFCCGARSPPLPKPQAQALRSTVQSQHPFRRSRSRRKNAFLFTNFRHTRAFARLKTTHFY